MDKTNATPYIVSALIYTISMLLLSAGYSIGAYIIIGFMALGALSSAIYYARLHAQIPISAISIVASAIAGVAVLQLYMAGFVFFSGAFAMMIFRIAILYISKI